MTLRAETIMISYTRAEDDVLLLFHSLAASVIIQIHSGDPLNSRNPFPPMKTAIQCDPASSSAIDVIQGWLADCQRDHVDCNAYTGQSRYLPTRLLQILGKGKVRLMLPSENVRYTALSYCWGKSDQPLTTTDNHSRRFDSFEYDDFPQTLKDAIVYTQALGVNYIWIDCLCIVQDNEDDWASEAARLADIYSGAFVVLAATRAQDVAEGFLSIREEPRTICLARGRRGFITVQARRVSNHSSGGSLWNLKSLPLFRQGWCMQERLLACRIVHFLPDEILFECRQAAHCECGLLKSTEAEDKSHKTLWPVTNEGDLNDDNIGYHVFENWRNIAREFSSLTLTYPDGVLPALSGIARRALTLRPGRYLAGIWEAGIAFNLRTKRVEPIEAPNGPTFSWISSLHAITYPYLSKIVRPICTYLEGDSTHTTIDSFGRVSHVYVRLHGRCVEGSALLEGLKRRDMLILDENARFGSGLLRIHIDRGARQFSLDSEGRAMHASVAEALDWSTVKCFGLFHDPYYSNDPVTMLLLSPAPDGTSFVRVGLVQHLTSIWFRRHATDCTVTIV